VIAPLRRRDRRPPVGEVGVAERLADLDALAPAWDALIAPAAPPTLHFAWAAACAQALDPRDRLRVLFVGPSERATAILPLVVRHGRAQRIELLGSERYEPMDVLGPASALAPLVRAMVAERRPLALKRLLASSPLLPALRAAFGSRAVVYDGGASPYIPLDPRWEEPEAMLNAGRRSDLRRALRIAERMGSVRHEVVTPSPSQTGPLLEEVMHLEVQGWKGRAGTAMASDPQAASFFRDYAARAAASGILRMCALRIDGRAAATQVAVESGGRFWLLKVAYDEAFRRCSPGILLMLHTLREAAARGLTAYELLGVAEPWLSPWTDRFRACVSLRAYPLSGAGLLALASDAREAARRARMEAR
jgi:CelD/BcsL family acetyltransferase involved in cellulose biosynthesis